MEETQWTPRNLDEYLRKGGVQPVPRSILERLTKTQAAIAAFARSYDVEYGNGVGFADLRDTSFHYGVMRVARRDGKPASRAAFYRCPTDCPRHVHEALELWCKCEVLKHEWRLASFREQVSTLEQLALRACEIAEDWAMIRGLKEHAAAAATRYKTRRGRREQNTKNSDARSGLPPGEEILRLVQLKRAGNRKMSEWGACEEVLADLQTRKLRPVLCLHTAWRRYRKARDQAQLRQ